MDTRVHWYERLKIAAASMHRRKGMGGDSTGPAVEPGQNGSGSQSHERPEFKILIVEDNRSFREALGAGLQAHFPNLNVTMAGCIQEAHAKLQSTQPDLMFIDMRLPDGNGLDFTRSVRAAGNKCVIIVLTSHDLPEYRVAASSSGANHFMTKGSVHINDIFAVVESFIALRFG